jgi:DNA-binding LytR/AlgR family response regulator
MTCIFIDDEATARIILEKLCANVTNLDVIDQFSNAIDAIKFLNKNEIDLIFLDIHMPGFNGFDFIQTIKNSPKIILTTSDRNFAIEAFEYESIVDYLVKPVSQERFNKAVAKAVLTNVPILKHTMSEKLNESEDFYINIDKRLIKINFDSIELIKAKGDYIELITDSETFTVHTTLKKIISKLPESNFLKVHRSYVINTSKIVDFQDNSVLISKHVIPVSRSNRPVLLQKINLL